MRVPFVCLLGALAACSSGSSSPPCSSCPVPGAPTFSGIVAVAPTGKAGTLRVSWAPATDDKTAAAQLKYKIYASIHPGVATSRPAVLTTDPGATSAYIEVAPAGATHYVVVHAVDGDGNEDVNRVEKSAPAVADTTPPTFAGITGVAPVVDGSATISWNPASDDLSPPEALRYAIYAGPEVVSFVSPVAIVENVTQYQFGRIGADGASFQFAVRAIDAADNIDANELTLNGTLGKDTEAPAFGGCASVVARGSNGLVASWTAAIDDDTAQSAIAYDVYVSKTAGGEDFTAPTAATVVGATSATVRNLGASTPYYVVCRARDRFGNRETNTVEQSATTTSNTTPPTFGGLANAMLDAVNRTVTLVWAPASDDTTPVNQIVYEAFESTTTGAYDFTAPIATSDPGASQVVLTGLPSATTLYWVVRARDADYNDDPNAAEISGTTDVSFSLDILPLFTHDCAVVGCHTSALPMAGMALSDWSAYDAIVGVNAGERPGGVTLKRINPGDPANSYLYRKILGPTQATIVGNQMPAPATGNTLSDAEKNLVMNWILQSAPRN